MAAQKLLETSREASKTYADLAQEAFGNDYLKENLQADLVGMFGAEWYYSTHPDNPDRSEGVDSSLLQKKFADSLQELQRALSALFSQRGTIQPETAKVLDEIIETLPTGRTFDPAQILSMAKSKLPGSLIERVKEALSARQKASDFFHRRDLQMLRSMKARTGKGLLVVGQAHPKSLREQFHYYCQSPRVPSNSVLAPDQQRSTAQ